MSIHQYRLKSGREEGFEIEDATNFAPTDAPAGSPEKIEMLRQRVARGLPLWHPNDRVDMNGLTAAIEPRNNGRHNNPSNKSYQKE